MESCVDVKACGLERVCMCDLDIHLGAHLSVSSQMFLYGSMTRESVANKGDYFDGAGQRRSAGLIMT